jgi:hypothetical protein
VDVATGKSFTWSEGLAAFSEGAFFGAVGAGAGTAGGTIAKALDFSASGALAGFTSRGIVAAAAIGIDLVKGNRDWRKIGLDAAIAFGTQDMFEDSEVLSTTGMDTIAQAEHFAPRTLGAFERALVSPSTAGRNAVAVIYGSAFEDLVGEGATGLTAAFWSG